MNRLGSFPVSPGHINPPVILGPNISGSFSLPGTEAPSKTSHTGVFTVPGNTTGDYASGHVSGGGNPIVYLDSTLVSTVYKEISTIQPQSAYAFIIIKV